MRWAPTNLATRDGHGFRLSTPPQASALTAYPPVAAALAEERLQGWLRIAPAGLWVAVVLRGSTRPRRQVQLLRSAVPGA